jgi:vacuolar protein sorting-associated protein 54
MTQDVNHVATRLGPLSEAGRTVSSLETLVKDKTTPRKPMGETMKGLLRRNGTVDKGKEKEVGKEVKIGDGVAAEEEEEDLDSDGVEVVPANGGEVAEVSDGQTVQVEGSNGDPNAETVGERRER